MKNFWLRLEQKTDDSDNGGGPQYDDLGYEIPATPPAPAPAPPAPTIVEPPKPPEVLATGYDKEPVVPPAPPAPPSEPPVPLDLGFEVKTEGLSDDEALKLKTFAKTHGLTQGAAQALIDDRVATVKKAGEDATSAQQQAERQIAETRAGWHKELKADPTFGGENFAHNIARVERVVEDFMPNLKKVLTERKTMLPPYVMRDLANVAQRLYETPRMTPGEPPSPPPEKVENDPLAFYKGN